MKLLGWTNGVELGMPWAGVFGSMVRLTLGTTWNTIPPGPIYGHKTCPYLDLYCTGGSFDLPGRSLHLGLGRRG